MVYKACFSQMLITKQSSFVFLSSHVDCNGTAPARMALSQGADIGWRSACCHVPAAVIRREQSRASQKCNISGERRAVHGGLWQREMWCLPVWLTCLLIFTCFSCSFSFSTLSFRIPTCKNYLKGLYWLAQSEENLLLVASPSFSSSSFSSFPSPITWTQFHLRPFLRPRIPYIYAPYLCVQRLLSPAKLLEDGDRFLPIFSR